MINTTCRSTAYCISPLEQSVCPPNLPRQLPADWEAWTCPVEADQDRRYFSGAGVSLWWAEHRGSSRGCLAVQFREHDLAADCHLGLWRLQRCSQGLACRRRAQVRRCESFCSIAAVPACQCCHSWQFDMPSRMLLCTTSSMIGACSDAQRLVCKLIKSSSDILVELHYLQEYVSHCDCMSLQCLHMTPQGCIA